MEELLKAGLDLGDDAAETVKLLLSELLTNAIRHGYGGEIENPSVRILVRAEAQPTTGLLRVAVLDPSAAVPEPRKTGADAESGRGLPLVDALSTRYGWVKGQDGAKWVWFEINVTCPALGAATSVQKAGPDEQADAGRREWAVRLIAVLDAYKQAPCTRSAPRLGAIRPRSPRRAVTVQMGRVA
nr:ATP-binding protein [Kitasatospora sp. GP82]